MFVLIECVARCWCKFVCCAGIPRRIKKLIQKAVHDLSPRQTWWV